MNSDKPKEKEETLDLVKFMQICPLEFQKFVFQQAGKIVDLSNQLRQRDELIGELSKGLQHLYNLFYAGYTIRAGDIDILIQKAVIIK